MKKPQKTKSEQPSNKSVVLADLKDRLIRVIGYTIHHKAITLTEIQKSFPKLQSTDLWKLREGNYNVFSIEKLLIICDALDIDIALIATAPSCVIKSKDPALDSIFRQMIAAATHLSASVDSIGHRSYTVAKFTADATATLLKNAAYQISREPYFWHRDAELMSEQLMICRDMLKKIKQPSSSVVRSITALKELSDALSKFYIDQCDDADDTE